MKDTLALETGLQQQQRLTPLQVQFVNMLEMTTPEVEEAVRHALDEMPALATVDSDTEQEGTRRAENSDNGYDDTPAYRYRTNNHSSNDTYYDVIAAAPERSETLIEALSRQLALSDLDRVQQVIAINIIGNLDDNGYITRDLQSIADDVAASTGEEVTPSMVNAVWQIIRSLDPAGIAAVDLRDCLLLQLKRMQSTPAVDTATEIIAHYYDLFSKMHFDRLQASMGISKKELRDAIEVIRRLNPKPGATFAYNGSDLEARHIIPDFNVEIDGDRLILTMPAHIPELTIEESFDINVPVSITPKTPREEEARLFIRNKREEAQDFIKALSMRRDTLFRVMQAILSIQREYFITGDESTIRPMILRDIQELTGYSLSMISRATAGKYVATPHGTIPLKMLFNEKPKDSADTSTHQILSSLRELIENENPRRPLSDEQLTKALTEKGYDIARRTVAKYRERIGIPVARLRKKI